MTSVGISTSDPLQQDSVEDLSFVSIIKQIALQFDNNKFVVGRPSLPIEINYQGEFKNGLYHGLGVLKFGDGIVYEGNFEDHKLQGKGKMRWPDGSVYQGEFKNGKRSGIGTYTSKRLHYEGEWKDGKKHGKGILKFLTIENEYYEGEFQNDQRHGIGTMYYKSGDIYEGNWFHNKRHGKGILYFTTLHQKYDGEWENGLPNGKGLHYYFNFASKTCNFYDGQFKNGKREGFGIFYYADGSRYIGEWSQNLKHGEGEIQSFGGVVKRNIYNMDKVVQSLDETKSKENQIVSLYIDDLVFLSASQQVSIFDPIIEIQDLFARNIPQLKQIFYHYCTVNSQPIICFVKDVDSNSVQKIQYTLKCNLLNLAQFWKFVHDCGILGSQLQLADVDRIFFVSSFFENKQHRPISRRTTLRSSIKRNAQELPSMINPKTVEASLHHPKNLICFREFMECIVRIASVLYDDSHLHPKDQQLLSTKVIRLLEQHVLPLTSKLTQMNDNILFGHTKLEYQRVINKHSNLLQKIFVVFGEVYQQERKNAEERKELDVFNEVITVKQYVHMLCELKLLPDNLSPYHLLEALAKNTRQEVIYIEFLELLFQTSKFIHQNEQEEVFEEFVEKLIEQALCHRIVAN